MSGLYDPAGGDLEVTDKKCLECGSNYGDDAEICVVCDEAGDDPHMLEAYHVADAPLGYMDDEDYRVLGTKTTIYEYPVQEDV